MGLIGKAKNFIKKVGKANPKEIAKKVGKVAHNVIGTADKVLGKIEDVGNKIANIPIVGDMAKNLYKAPIIKGVSAEMMFQGAKTGVNVAKRAEGQAQNMIARLPEGNLEDILSGKGKFSNRPVANIGNKHLHTQSESKFRNDVVANAGKHPVIQSRIKGVMKHLQSQQIMNATPLSQIPRTVRHITRTNVVGALG